MEGETRWTVLGPGTHPNKVRCRCACGTEREVNKKNIKAGITRSCGCFKLERATSHGKTHSPEYRVWQRMYQRTENEHSQGYERWGGRGIRVCLRWATFENFYADMGNRPSDDHSLDRIDNDGGYWCGKAECPECRSAEREPNCRWATRSEQQRNKRDTRFAEYRGVTKSLADWSEELDIPLKILKSRLDKGWGMEEAAHTPIYLPRGPQAPKFKDRPIEYEGRVQTASQWAAEFGLRWTVFESRMSSGWDMDRIRYARQRKKRSDSKQED